MKYLLVVAHPDDETLGAGASMYKWIREGQTVDVAIMCTEAKARAFRPEDNDQSCIRLPYFFSRTSRHQM